MPVRFDVVGTGLTKRVQPHLILPSIEESDGRIILSVSEPCSEEDGAALIAYMKNGTSTDPMRAWEVLCQDVLRKAGLPPWDKYVSMYADGTWADDLPEDWHERIEELVRPEKGIGRAIGIAPIDSEPWFAATILQEIHRVRQAVARGETERAAFLGCQVGLTMATAAFKFTWESAAMAGKPLQTGRPRGTKHSAHSRRQTMLERQSRVREAADKIWKEHPEWIQEDVLRALRRNDELADVKESSRRSYLKKPEEWSTLKSHKQKT